jgi:hypothetical protein
MAYWMKNVTVLSKLAIEEMMCLGKFRHTEQERHMFEFGSWEYTM